MWVWGEGWVCNESVLFFSRRWERMVEFGASSLLPFASTARKTVAEKGRKRGKFLPPKRNKKRGKDFFFSAVIKKKVYGLKPFSLILKPLAWDCREETLQTIWRRKNFLWDFIQSNNLSSRRKTMAKLYIIAVAVLVVAVMGRHVDAAAIDEGFEEGLSLKNVSRRFKLKKIISWFLSLAVRKRISKEKFLWKNVAFLVSFLSNLKQLKIVHKIWIGLEKWPYKIKKIWINIILWRQVWRHFYSKIGKHNVSKIRIY